MNNREIIEHYYRLHRDELLAFASSRLGDYILSEDIVQNVFLRLLMVGEPIMEASLPSLAYTYLRRLLIDCYRRRLIREEGEHELMRATAMDESAESLLSVREVTEQLERGLARLPEDCREYYRLHVYEGMKTAEISEATGQLYRNVEYRLGVARKQIRNYLRHIS